MNIKEYMDNPLGKGNASYPTKMAAKEFSARYQEVKGGMSHKVHLVRDRLFIHILVPSSIPDIYYDVILNFIPNARSVGVSVLDMDFKVVSNCPSFVFTYAYAYNKRGLVVTDIQRKLTRQAIKQSADVRNPYNMPGYEYSIFMAILYLYDKSMTQIDSLTSQVTKSLTLAPLVKNIQDFDSLMKRRKVKEEQMRDKNKKETEKIKKVTAKVRHMGSQLLGSEGIADVKNTQHSKIIGSILGVKGANRVTKLKKK